MSTLLASSKGQTVLPAALRRRLGWGVGARLEVIEESDGLRLTAYGLRLRPMPQADLGQLAGRVTADGARAG
jgi:antitoxin PrlF